MALQAGSSSPIRTPGSRSSARRGGFGDSGTLGSNGELPEASVLYVESEAVLTEELRAITDSLRSDVQWDTRVMAMLKLEGVIKGGAADQYPAFADLVLCLQVGLATQLQDRRSAVSRQACHVISVVVQSCRLKVEPLAVGLFPVLLKVPAMGIQVVNEAAEACVRTIIRRCPSHRLLPSLCTMIKADKNAKLRQSAADYLAQVLQEWLPAEYDRQTVAIEAAILAACADSGAETRAAGKAAFAAYFAKRPAEAQAMVQLLPNTERALRDRLMATIDAAQGAGGCC